MKFDVELSVGEGGEYVAECQELGVRSAGLSASNALDALRANIRYHLEYCPCTSVGEDVIQLDVIGQ